MAVNTYKRERVEVLIELAQKNDIKAIEALIRHEQKHIYAIFSHLTDKRDDIADLTQEVLFKMAKNINHLKDKSNFRQWLNKIISNTFYDFTKRNSNNSVGIDETKLEDIKDKPSCEPGEKYLFSEIETYVKNALISLPKNLRLSIVLREYEGLSYEDISKIMNTTIGTVKSRISRARMKLREELSEYI